VSLLVAGDDLVISGDYKLVFPVPPETLSIEHFDATSEMSLASRLAPTRERAIDVVVGGGARVWFDGCA
jgi:hypothetical protein